MFHIFSLDFMVFLNSPDVAFFKKESSLNQSLKLSKSWALCSFEDYYAKYPRGLV